MLVLLPVSTAYCKNKSNSMIVVSSVAALGRSACTRRRLLQASVRYLPFSSSADAQAEEQFQNALKALKNLDKEPSSDIKLKLYALFKTATVGSCNEPSPSLFDPVGRAKHNAWKSLNSMSSAEAKREYATSLAFSRSVAF